MSRSRSLSILLVLGLACSGIAVFAQAPTGIIEGTVTDASGAVVPNATLTITNKATGISRDVTAGSNGTYSAPALNAGDYEVKAALTGFKTVVESATVNAGADVTVNIALSVGTASDVVNVEASAAQINYESNAVQGDIERATIQDIPLNGRSFMQLASLEPGVTVGLGSTAQFNTLFTVSVLGGGNHTAYSIDGGVISDNITTAGGIASMNFSQDMIQEFQLSSAVFDLSTPINTGGAINIVSRSGSNEFHGTGYFFFRDHNTAAYPNLFRAVPGSDQPTSPFFARRNPGVAVGGPIKKDKLFFFANFEYLNQVQAINIASNGPSVAALQGTYDSPYAGKQTSVRLDYHLNDKNNIFLRYSHDGNSGFGQALEFGDPSNWAHNINWADQYITGLTTTITPSIVNDVRFQYNYWNNKNLPATASDCSLPCVGGQLNIYTFIGTNLPATGNNFDAPQTRNTRRFELNDALSWQKGAHRIRVGADLAPTASNGAWGFCAPMCVGAWAPEELKGLGLSAVFPQASLILTSDASALQLPVYNGNSSIFSGVGVGNTSTPAPYGYSQEKAYDQYRVFVQDTWKVKESFTLNYGLAWNAQTGFYNSNLQKPAYLAPILGANELQPSVNNLKEFQPSFGFTWSPFKDHKTVIRGGGGIYWDSTPGYYKLRDASVEGPPGNGRSTLSASAFTVPPGQAYLNISAGGTPMLPGSALPIGALTTMTITQFVNIVNSELPAISAILAPSNPITSGAYPFSEIDYAKQGVEIYPEHFPLPRSYQTNIGIQRELPWGMLVTADYARKLGINTALGEIDQNLYSRFEGSSTPVPVIPLCAPSQVYTPGIECSSGSITVWNDEGRSLYNALLMKAQKRYSNKLFFQVSYAYQHLDTLTPWNLANFSQGYGQVLGHQNLNIAAYYDLPWGFQLSINSSNLSPAPGTVTVSTTPLILPGTIPSGSTEPLPGLPYGCVNNGCGPAQIQAAVNAFNTTYVTGGLLNAKGQKYTPLALPTNYSLGQWTVSQDVGLTKTFTFKERYKLAIRAEGFNIFNIANNVAPGLTVDAASATTFAFGQYTNRVGQSLGSGGPRAFQFSGRIQF